MLFVVKLNLHFNEIASVSFMLLKFLSSYNHTPKSVQSDLIQ